MNFGKENKDTLRMGFSEIDFQRGVKVTSSVLTYAYQHWCLGRDLNAQPSDMSQGHLLTKRAIKSHQTHLTQQPKSSDPLDAAPSQLTATTHTFTITNISFVHLSTDSMVGSTVVVVSK
ncbi:hypothetical protein TNCV_4606911 [Trichonephila clavipes]|nr:hypothetical protein TNCV_4606911 [Trichonephila clavipes]